MVGWLFFFLFVCLVGHSCFSDSGETLGCVQRRSAVKLLGEVGFTCVVGVWVGGVGEGVGILPSLQYLPSSSCLRTGLFTIDFRSFGSR